MAKPVRDNEKAEDEAIHPEDRLVLAFHHGQDQQGQWEDAAAHRARHTARNAERAPQLGLANAQSDQGYELQHQRGAIEHDVQGDQPAEARAPGKAPSSLPIP